MKSQISIISCLITLCFGFSQQSITGNSPNLVKGDLNLINSISKLYLTDEAQPVKKEDSKGNTGLGMTSVYHEGNKSQWAYKSWCLLESEFFRPVKSEDNQSSNTTQIKSSLTLPSDQKKFRVYVTFNNLFTRELLLNFQDSATSGFDDGVESVSLDGVSNDAYWNINGVECVTQALPYSNDLEIPIELKTTENLSVEFNIDDIQNFDENQSIYLFDEELGTFTDLRLYSHVLEIPSGTFSERFKIIFNDENSSLGTDKIKTKLINVYSDISQDQLIVENPQSLKLSNITVYDLGGKLISKQTPKTIKESYTLSTKHWSSSVYIITTAVDNGVIHSQKLIIK